MAEMAITINFILTIKCFEAERLCTHEKVQKRLYYGIDHKLIRDTLRTEEILRTIDKALP